MQGWIDFYQAAEIHWKWLATVPQHLRKSHKPPPGHAFNVYTVTNSDEQEYATTVMGLDEEGASTLFAHVQFLWEIHSEWEQRVEKAIEKNRWTRGSPNNEVHPLSDCDGLLWISTQCKLAKIYPNCTPKELRSTTQEGYFSMIECGAALDIRSALLLLKRENKVQILILAKLKRVREASYLKYVAMANHLSTRDKLLQLQEFYPMLPAFRGHFQHYNPISKQSFGDCYNRGQRVQSTRLGQGSGASPVTFVLAHQCFTETGYRPASGSSSTKLHCSAATTHQGEESASIGGREELSL
jgi:hypothetical protein